VEEYVGRACHKQINGAFENVVVALKETNKNSITSVLHA